MLTLKVPLKQAQKAKRYLIKQDIYDRSYRVHKEKGHIYFPVKEKDENIGFGTYEEKDLEKRSKKQSYQDYLKDSFSADEFSLLPSSYDILGDLIIIDMPQGLQAKEEEIAQALLKAHRQVKTVLKRADMHKGEFRTQDLAYLAGEKKKETIYKENNASIMLDAEKVYFSPRLGTERKRVAGKVKPGEKVLVMFSGCGPYPLVIAKNTEARKVVGVEKNPVAHNYALKNKKLNKVDVDFYVGDVRAVVPNLPGTFDRIIMPLPKDAHHFLDLALTKAKEDTVIHLYLFGESKEDVDAIVKEACSKLDRDCTILDTVECGSYSPSTSRYCVDFTFS